ncbi:protein yellow-like [Contarinia nasturtii]|uniref:protein yellow-like n=1 Tax=Contarinia nasturtii TaxID=265458 RepID=UPI0012D3AD43|nr:protein yellow-like [Contarinia nasturtii]
MKYIKFLLILLFAVCIQNSFSSKLEEKFRWKEVSYAWPSDSAMDEAIKSGRYQPENNLPLGLEVWKDKLFITVPRWKSGVASSLNYINIDSKDSSPLLIPYPSWTANSLESDGFTTETTGGRMSAPKPTILDGQLTDNSSIISTFRIRVDECDRLWVMDTGLADILGSNPKQIAQPALVIFDLNTNKLIKRYTIPPEHIKDDTFFANVIVDVPKNGCDNAYAYIPDLGAYATVVYSFKSDRSWRVRHNFFYFDPINGDYNVGGVNFQWKDGIFALALGEQTDQGTRTVYFHALSSTKEFSVPNYILQNETRALSAESYFDYSLVGDRGLNGQSTSEFFDEKTKVLVYTQVNKDGIGCWNSQKPYTPDNQGILDSDSDALVFPNDLKIDRNGNVWVLSDRLPIFIYKKLNPNEYNYRILTGKVGNLILGTPCE